LICIAPFCLLRLFSLPDSFPFFTFPQSMDWIICLPPRSSSGLFSVPFRLPSAQLLRGRTCVGLAFFSVPSFPPGCDFFLSFFVLRDWEGSRINVWLRCLTPFLLVWLPFCYRFGRAASPEAMPIFFFSYFLFYFFFFFFFRPRPRLSLPLLPQQHSSQSHPSPPPPALAFVPLLFFSISSCCITLNLFQSWS